MINPKHIAAACHTAATSDARFYLKGVFVDGPWIVSTDGSCLSAYHGEDAGLTFIIPLDAAKRIGKLNAPTTPIVRMCDGWIGVGGVVFAPVDGTFPDWRRVVPKAAPVSAPRTCQVDPELLIKFSKIAKSLGTKAKPVLCAAEARNDTVRVALPHPGFIGVIMGLRVTADAPVCEELA